MSENKYNGLTEAEVDGLQVQLECADYDISRLTEKKKDLQKSIDLAKKEGYLLPSERFAEMHKPNPELVKKKSARKAKDE